MSEYEVRLYVLLFLLDINYYVGILLPRLRESPVAPDFQRIATLFFHGEELPYSEDESVMNHRTFNITDPLNHVITYEDESLDALRDAYHDPCFMKFVTELTRCNELETCIKQRETYCDLTVRRGKDYLTYTRVLDLVEMGEGHAVLSDVSHSDFSEVEYLIDVLKRKAEHDSLDIDIDIEPIENDSEDISGTASGREPIGHDEANTAKSTKKKRRRRNKNVPKVKETTQDESHANLEPRYEINSDNNAEQEQSKRIGSSDVSSILDASQVHRSKTMDSSNSTSLPTTQTIPNSEAEFSSLQDAESSRDHKHSNENELAVRNGRRKKREQLSGSSGSGSSARVKDIEKSNSNSAALQGVSVDDNTQTLNHPANNGETERMGEVHSTITRNDDFEKVSIRFSLFSV